MTSKILVTGGTGFVAGHLISQLLAEGHAVRTTVRASGREEAVLKTIDSTGESTEKLEFVVADLESDDGWLEATAGVSVVHHVASPFPAGIPENDEEVIAPARDGTLRVLRAATENQVHRVVLTSSFAAVGYTRKPDGRYDESDWTDPQDDNSPYIKSKVIAEKAAWSFVEHTRGAPELTVVIPVGIFGPPLNGDLSVSIGIVQAMLAGAMPVVPPFHFGAVDVRDVADAHIRAMRTSEAAGQRFLVTAGTTSFLEIASTLRAELGEVADKVPRSELSGDELREAAEHDPDLMDPLRQLGQVPIISNDKARRVLGWTPRPLKTTMTETAESLLRLGLV